MLDSTSPAPSLPREKTCTMDGCHKPIQARGMCGSHYGTWYRQTKKKHQYTCDGCGKKYWTGRKQQKSTTFCSNQCQVDHRVRSLPPLIRECDWCSEEFQTRDRRVKYCSPMCKEEAATDRRLKTLAPIRRAYETGDHAGVIEALREGSTHTPEGCWEWRTIRDGYPVVRLSKNGRSLAHRVSIEAAYGKPLGSQHAHHICANTKCVNPEHLQPVTARDNTAEMLARTSYLNRIEELERALEELAPGHELLNRIPLS